MKKFEVYFCPICGRTVTHEVNPDTLPNIHCGPHEDEVTGAFMVCMAQIFPQQRSTVSKELTGELQHLIDQSKVRRYQITAQGIMRFLEEKRVLGVDPVGKLNEETYPTHKEQHKLLHKMLDELLADFIRHTGNLPSRVTLMEFLTWSCEQTGNPTEEKK